MKPFGDQYLLNNNTQDKNWTQDRYEGQDFKSPDMSAILTSWQVIPPFLIILGSIGNALIIAVLTRPAMQKGTTERLFCVLAASDLIGLYVGLLPEWIESLTNTNYHRRGDFPCKVLPWIKYSLLDYSAWILVAVTAERVIATCFPLVSKTMCTRRFVVGYLVSSGLILLCINAHMLYGFESKEEDIPGYGPIFDCSETPESYRHFYERIWPWIDVTVYCILPFIVICVGNGIIVFRVKSSYQRSSPSHVSISAKNKTMSLSRKKGKKKISNLTLTLLLVNSAFFVSTFPVSVFEIVQLLSEEYFEDRQNKPHTEMWWVFVYNFMFLNNTFNVFLYCLSGSKFRHGALALLRTLMKFRPSTAGEIFRGRKSESYRPTDGESKVSKKSRSTKETPESKATSSEHDAELKDRTHLEASETLDVHVV